MENRVSNSEINTWINDIVTTLGIKEPAPCEKYAILLNRGATKDCIQSIAAYLGLPVKIELTFVARHSRASTTSGFVSKDLVQTDSHGRGSNAITAQVSIPSWLPLYGSRDLRDYPIRVKISEDCQDHVDSFIAVMAHELSHIVLASLSHREKDNEWYTDLTAMVLGFADVTKHGRRVSETTTSGNQQITHTTTYGYLSDGQFAFAYDKIVRLLEDRVNRKKDLLLQIKGLNRDLARSNKMLRNFKEFGACLDKNTAQRINAKDGLRIVQFHQPGYANEYEKVLNSTEKAVAGSEQPISEITHHTKTTGVFMQKKAEELKQVKSTLSSLSKTLAEDVKVLKRNVPLLYRLKRFLIWQPEQ